MPLFHSQIIGDMRVITACHLIVIFAVTILAYLNVMNAVFLSLDDRYMIGVMQGSETNALGWLLGGGGDYFRPLVFWSFDLDFKLFGPHPAGFHLVNLAIHLSNAFLIYYLASILGREAAHRNRIALVSSIFYAITPLNTEAVAWISGRFDLLCCFFFLLAIIVAVEKNISVFKASLALFIMLLCSLLSKEASVGFVVIFCAYLATDLPASRSRRSVVLLAAVWLATGLYLFLRTGLTAKADSGIAKVVGSTKPMMTIIFESVAAYGFYMKKFFMPFPLNFAITAINKPLYAGVGVAMLLVLSYVFVRFRESRLPVLIVVVSLIPPVMALHGGLPWTPYAERYLYLPMTGMALLMGLLSAYLPRTLFIPFFSLILLCAFPTMQRINLWADPRAFWLDVMTKSPEFPRSYSGVAIEFMAEKRYDEAEKLFRKTLSMGYEREFIWENLARIHLARKDLAAYEAAMCRAAELAPVPRSTQMYSALTQILIHHGSKTDSPEEVYRRVVSYYLKAYDKDNTYSDGLYNAGKTAMLAGDHDNAVLYFEKFLKQPRDNMFKPFARQLIAKLKTNSQSPGD